MKKTILILHGWGVNGKRYSELSDILQNEGFSIYSPDLPGFGEEKLKKDAMTVDDYVSFVKDYMKKKNLNNIIVIAHSFGGRIAIKLASSQNTQISKLILTGSAGIKPKLSLFVRSIQFIALTFSELFRFSLFRTFKNKIRKMFYFIIGEWDYYNAGDLRETFKKVIAEDLTSYLSKITIPTLLVWGENDKIIHLSDGEKIENLIPNAKLVVIKNRGHKLPYEAPQEFVNAIMPFLA